MARDRDYPPPLTLAAAVAAVIRKELAARGWTAKRLATETGIDYQQLSRYYLPVVREIKTTDLQMIAVAFDTTVSSMFAQAESDLREAVYRNHNPQSGDTPQ